MKNEMNNKGYSKALNEQVQKLKITISKDINQNINQQLQELAKKDAAKDLEKIKNAIDKRIFNRLSSIDRQLNDKKTTHDSRKSLIRELSVLIQPKTVLAELNSVLTVSNTWKTYSDFYEKVSKNSMFSSILKRYKADSKVFTYYQQGLLENTNDLLKTLETHGQQLQSYNQVMQEITAERGEKQLLNLGVGLVGAVIAGPLGGIVGRKISQAMTSDEDRINYSGSLVDKTWDQVYATYQKLLTKLGSEYFNIYFSLYGGFAQRINSDLNKFGYEAEAFDGEAMCFSFTIKASEVKKVDVWLQKNTQTLEEAFRKNQHSFSQDLFQKMESYVKRNVPFGEVSIDGEKVKDTISALKFNYMLAFIEKEFWQKKNDAEALKQYMLLLEKMPVQIETSSAFADIQLPSMEVIVSRMIHLSVTKFKETKKSVFNSFHHYHSLQKDAKPSSVQMMKVFELYNGYTTNKKRISLKLSDVSYKALHSIYIKVIKEREYSKDVFSKHLKKKLYRTKTKLKPLFSFYDSYREAFLRFKIIQPRYIVSFLVALSLMMNWASFASAGKFLPGADGLYFNFIENKTLDTQLDDYALNKAVIADNKPRILQLLSLGADPNLVLDEGKTLLEKAVLEKEGLAYIENLLTLGADPNIRSGKVPLIYFAINTKDEQLVKLLLSFGMEPFADGENGYDALVYIDSLGTSNQYYDIMMLLLDEYENMDGYAVGGTMLKKTLAENDLTALEKMFELGADVNGLIDEKPLLFYAVDSGASKEIFEFLFDKGAKINSTDHDEKNLLLYLTDHRNKTHSLYKYFLEKGGYIDAQDSDGNTPLLIAAKEKDKAIINLLLKSGANPNLKNKQDYTALEYAMEYEELDSIEKLLPLTEIKEEDYLKWLKAAVTDQNVEFVNLLLELDSVPEIIEKEKQNLLYISVENEDSETLLSLLNLKIDVNFLNEDILSPLEYAQENEFEKITQILLESGALKNLGHLSKFEGYWESNENTITHIYAVDNHYTWEEYSGGESLQYSISDELEILKDDEVHSMGMSKYLGAEFNFDEISLETEFGSYFNYRRIEEDEFETILEEQKTEEKEKEALLAKEEVEERKIEKEENRKMELMQLHEPLVGGWVTGEEGKDKEEIFISISSEDEEIFIVVEGLTYTYAVALDMNTSTVEGNVLHFGDSDYNGKIQDKDTLQFYKEVHKSSSIYKRIE
ncbi:ankyrin repeat protein [Planomicrobium stackebrandtii]|uniref:Ankyrin repeat protein n=1 Tax=Planomicrobium stackebrandtii TaxID=253160 RepID=A0ABU0GTX4_9BACL|nr:ankyrin repeat domain-containing protein [Planomicrobium stackebrandtii]MDQ0428801.1 ankyrin repeat protein [Planomicrobium stackebrandtii]